MRFDNEIAFHLRYACCEHIRGIHPNCRARSPGNIQFRVFATGTLPSGDIDQVERDDFDLPAGSRTRVTDSVVLTIAAEYFIFDTLLDRDTPLHHVA